ncbi:MAG: TonB-dependent receptor [Lewinellaceae bacterium]|nr:TonB-dependent receptor [Saprospiraceae bacterium]MCB9345431.1 TonB-dependent receptor [Lewinellaceae bacterium]
MSNQTVFVLFLLLMTSASSAQTNTKPTILTSVDYQINGQVVDGNQGMPLAYASVAVFRSIDSISVSGALTDEEGRFTVKVEAGVYYARVDYLGYDAMVIPNILVDDSKETLDLGKISLYPSSTNLDEVLIQAEKSSIQMTLDKKIFNVGKDLGNAGGSASDILNNIPSVQVGQEDEVSLRGSENVRILIDGKPSGLLTFKGADGLQQLQASMIERVEIITNPSARYDAEGIGGIINIVMKKDRSRGLNGTFDLTLGYPDNYSFGTNLNYRTEKLNFFAGYSPNYKNTPGQNSSYQELYTPDTLFIYDLYSKRHRKQYSHNFRFGADYFFNAKNILTSAFSYNRSQNNRTSIVEYRDYIFDLAQPTSLSTREQDQKETEPNLEYSLLYKRSFKRDGHELSGEFRYIDNWEDSDQLFTEKYYLPDGSASGAPDFLQESLNKETEKQYLFQIDYVKPFGKEGRFELGVKSTFRDLSNDYLVQSFIDNNWEAVPGLDNNFLYNEDIHALYAILGNKKNRFSYQLGLRTELSAVTTTLLETAEINDRDYNNLFPSAHFTYDLPKDNAIQLSYSRRIHRPRYHELNPFFTFRDSRNFWSGNPDLNPELIDAFEIGHIKYFGNTSLSSALYYRITNGKVDRIRRVDSLGFANTRPENLSAENAYGAEFIVSCSPYKWWKLDGSLNFFRSIITGSLDGISYDADTYSWFSTLTSRISILRKTDLQIRANFDAPRTTTQGNRKATSFLDIGISRDVFRNNGTITFNVSDVFNSRRWRGVTQGENFYNKYDFQRRPTQYNLSLNYRLHQSKKKPEPGQKQEGMEGGGDF